MKPDPKDIIAVVHTCHKVKTDHDKYPIDSSHLEAERIDTPKVANPEGFNTYDPWLDQDGYTDYIKEFGHHFNRKLAIWAISRMENDDGSDYHMMPEAVKSMWNKHGLTLPSWATWGDATYAYNMAYADYHPDPLETTEMVLKQSYKDIHDKDGYDGKVFNRWLSDVVYKRILVPWKEML